MSRFAVLMVSMAVLLPVAGWAAVADEHAELERSLHAFLAGASSNDPAVHEAFWADDLIYTSASGQRFGKAQIMAGLASASDEPATGPRYGAEDITIRVMDKLAVVTFRLTADEDGLRTAEYFNTGVFRKEGDAWRAFTWQATRIPAAD